MSDCHNIVTSKITFKLVRSFSVGFSIHSPTLNGFSVELFFVCFHLSVWSRGERLFCVRNYWNG